MHRSCMRSKKLLKQSAFSRSSSELVKLSELIGQSTSSMEFLRAFLQGKNFARGSRVARGLSRFWKNLGVGGEGHGGDGASSSAMISSSSLSLSLTSAMEVTTFLAGSFCSELLRSPGKFGFRAVMSGCPSARISPGTSHVASNFSRRSFHRGTLKERWSNQPSCVATSRASRQSRTVTEDEHVAPSLEKGNGKRSQAFDGFAEGAGYALRISCHACFEGIPRIRTSRAPASTAPTAACSCDERWIVTRLSSSALRMMSRYFTI
mmetsp:Transcript_51288/g.111319  ORF Transcript_51288/g.111319 Transcript_51288/m.111319 type:complete len:264 (-) Transcript_51288:391-1182(-)